MKRRLAAIARWWRNRTLHARLSILVTAAVTVAVLTVGVLAFTAVAETQRRQIHAQLDTAAQAIAAHPDRWQTPAAEPGDERFGRDRFRMQDFGPRWQVLSADGTVRSHSGGNGLPVTTGTAEVVTGRHRSAQEWIFIGGARYLMLTIPATGGGAVQVAISHEPATAQLTEFGLLLLAGCVVGIAGAALLGRVVARAGLKPVQRLTDAVEEVAATVDLQRPIPVDGVDEIARLGRSVNTMLGAIDTARQAQRSLVEDASHELRTPLTSIRTNIELLLSVERQPKLAHRLPPEDRVQLLRDLESQLRELTTLTTELVELAREETTREDVEPVELTEVVGAALDRVRTRAPGLTFTADLAPVTVSGRPGELERMVVNVLDNAAKWSPAGGTVHVTLRADGPGWCRLAVADTGPGIDEADRPYVFDRFYRAPAARALPGSGLGLAIVAQTALQHGGTAEVEANAPHGTVLVIRLPQSH